ncbi:MAG: hypothetical protein BWX86_01342 [Verrucomicrobia bacterium ADurb.Bin122]|nr:MAG: hypothetical protein BWX86_01342 [Verrucomicrobia bacterium ADurb.Bin122]
MPERLTRIDCASATGNGLRASLSNARRCTSGSSRSSDSLNGVPAGISASLNAVPPSITGAASSTCATVVAPTTCGDAACVPSDATAAVFFSTPDKAAGATRGRHHTTAVTDNTTKATTSAIRRKGMEKRGRAGRPATALRR